MASSKTCYWCGAPATSREHVPPDNLFPPGKKINLITVPSCSVHNEDLTALDEEFRVFLQARETSGDALSQFKDKTIRGLSRPESRKKIEALAKGSRRFTVDGQTRLALSVDPVRQNLFFEKIIRGLYFHIFAVPTTGQVLSYSHDFIVPGLDYASLAQKFVPLLNDPSVMPGNPGNPEVFDFKYIRVIEPAGEVFLVVMRFYQGVEVIGWSFTARSTTP